MDWEWAADFDICIPEWINGTWKWHGAPKLGERLCQQLGIDLRRASKVLITVERDYKVIVVAEYE